MSYSRSYINIALALLFAASLSVPLANAEPGGRDGRRGGPPQEAFDACVDKVEGDACSFTGDRGDAEGSFDEAYFEKKTNEDEEDWSDILALFAALHDDTASTDPATWRANFETTTTQMLYDTYSALVEPYATTERAGYSFLNGANDFYNAISELKANASSRDTAVDTYLSGQ